MTAPVLIIENDAPGHGLVGFLLGFMAQMEARLPETLRGRCAPKP